MTKFHFYFQMNNLKKISILFAFVLMCLPVFTFAQGARELPLPTGAGTSPEEPLIRCGERGGPECDLSHGLQLMQSILNLMFIFGGFVVAGMMIYSGFLMITAAGNMNRIQKAKDVFKHVVVGFLIMFLAYITVQNLLTNIKAREFFTEIFK